MANGFFQQKGSMELEDIGNGIFNDLLWRSFFQDVEKDIDGNVVACKMHDLVHDLASSITRDECFSVVTVGDEELIIGRGNTTRHLALDSDRLFSPNFALLMSLSCLRTFFHLGMYSHNSDVPPPLEFSNLICLRVLDLSRTRVKTLPVSIGKLKLLRYLDLSETRIALLPDEVFCNLRNLQTLKLRWCGELEMLPGNMRKLTNLRHLDIYNSDDKLVRMPVGMGQLKCLHELSHFIVSEDSGCGVGELQELDHLGGFLAITCLWKVRNPTDAKNAGLIRKQNIRSLQLNWLKTIPVSLTDDMRTKLIADALQPHPNIKTLYFCHYGGFGFPGWMNSTCLSSLVNLVLDNCMRCKHLPTLGLLPHLKFLKIISIPVECIANEFYSGEEGSIMMKTRGLLLFPSLEELEFCKMFNLEEWKGWSSSSSRMKEGEVQVLVFPVLNRLRVDDCPKLRKFPPLTLCVQHLELSNCSEKIFERSWESLPYLSDLSIRKFPCWAQDQGMLLLQNLPALQKLEMVDCSMLVSLPEGIQNLTSLKYLTFEGCNCLESLNNCFQLLINLHSLRIRNCPALELLPSDFQPLISLKVLQLKGFPNLAAVPVVGSSTLKTISFSMCPHLKNLPEWITNQTLLQTLELDDCENLKSLPEGFHQFTALQRLQIKGCHPLLHERCKEDTGEDWHKIAHIPECIIRLPARLKIVPSK